MKSSASLPFCNIVNIAYIRCIRDISFENWYRNKCSTAIFLKAGDFAKIKIIRSQEDDPGIFFIYTKDYCFPIGTPSGITSEDELEAILPRLVDQGYILM